MTKFRKKFIGGVLLAGLVGAMCLANASATTANAGTEIKPAPISRPDEVSRRCPGGSSNPQYAACRAAGGTHGQCSAICKHEN